MAQSLTTYNRLIAFSNLTERISLPLLFLVAAIMLLQWSAGTALAFDTTGSLLTARADHTATLLPNGKVLVAGGFNTPNVILSSAELYDPASGIWTATGSMATPRTRHTATLLSNGKVLVAGGARDSNAQFNSYLASAELYDPASGTWTSTGSLATPREHHTATLLPNGKVLAAFGFAAVGGGSTDNFSLNSAELYDPADGTWSPGGGSARRRSRHTATLLPNGKVLLAGGTDCCAALTVASLYDSTTGSWAETGDLNRARISHAATLLSSGKVLVVGGGFFAETAEVYDPASGIWALTGNLVTERGGHTATLLPNGNAFVVGGFYSGPSMGPPPASGELYDPASGSWKESGSLTNPRSHHTSTLLPNGKVLIAGGSLGVNTLASAELYPPEGALANMATRLHVGTSDNVLIAGFVIQGTAPKKVLIRAMGPSLTLFGIPDALANPKLELHNSTSTIALNDNWRTTQVGGAISADQSHEISNSGLPPSNDMESAIIATLAPGSYTAIVRGVGDTTGIGSAEVYDLSNDNGQNKLANMGSRGLVQQGDQVMIGGIIVINQPTKVVIRAIGPSLHQSGISNALENPQLELHDATSTIATNDDWQTTQIGGVITSDQTQELLDSHLAPNDPAESAIILTLQPGSYTAVVKGVNSTSGVGLVEVYALE